MAHHFLRYRPISAQTKRDVPNIDKNNVARIELSDKLRAAVQSISYSAMESQLLTNAHALL